MSPVQAIVLIPKEFGAPKIAIFIVPPTAVPSHRQRLADTRAVAASLTGGFSAQARRKMHRILEPAERSIWFCLRRACCARLQLGRC
jgi:hypothetical protein